MIQMDNFPLLLIIIIHQLIINIEMENSFMKKQTNRRVQKIEETENQVKMIAFKQMSKPKGIIEFQFSESLNLANIEIFTYFFQDNQIFCNKIIKYLKEMIKIVCDYSFSQQTKNNLAESQLKFLASTSILHNIKYLCQKIQKIIRKCHEEYVNMQIKKKYFSLSIQESYLKCLTSRQKLKKITQIDHVIRQIVEFICQQLNCIVKQIIQKYPRTTYSEKVINSIKTMDIREDYAFDFLYLYDINIKKASNSQYITKIMQFLNKIIQLPYKNVNNGENDKVTYQRLFIQFNKKILWIITQTNIKQKQINQFDQSILNFMTKGNVQNSIFAKQFKRCNKEEVQRKISEVIKRYQNINKFQANSKFYRNILYLYSQQQLKNPNLELFLQNFALQNVLFEWAQDMKEIFRKNEKYILNNIYSFVVNPHHKKVLVRISQEGRKILNQLVKKASKKIQYKKYSAFIAEILIKQGSELQSQQFSQLNGFIIKQTVYQLLKMFEILLQLPENWRTQEYLQQNCKIIKTINLICNRISNLFQSKLYCTQSQVTKLITLLYKLDELCSKGQDSKNVTFFRLIRVHNQLNETANNVLINYMFYGKIQCELQIFIQISQKDKTFKKTNTIRQYLSQLTQRGFGVVSQLANIKNLNDSTIMYNHFVRLSQKGYLNKNKQNICVSLNKLRYREKDQWVKHLLQNYVNFGIQQIDKVGKYDNDCKGIYLMIEPTQSYIMMVTICLIFQQQRTQRFIIASLQKDKHVSTKELTQDIYQGHIKRKNIYLKINYSKFAEYSKDKQFSYYFEPNNIKEIEKKAVQQLDNNFLDQQIKNLQSNNKLNKRYVKDNFKDQQKLAFIQRLQAEEVGRKLTIQSTQLQKLFIYDS